LTQLGCRVAAFAPLFWKYSEAFVPHSGVDLPHNLRSQFEPIRSCYSALADEWSRCELREQLRWRYWLDFEALSAPLDGRHIYFPFDLALPSEEEVFVDCGGFDGDTVRSFSEHWNGKFKRALTFEPDPSNRDALLRNVETIGIRERVTVMPYAVGNENGTVYFSLTNSAASHRVEDGAATPVECRRLDDIDWPETPTYIKMDIEGAEPDAIRGAARLLLRHQPILAICTYHRSNHLWEIPNLIHSINPGYRLFLRRYAEESWEGVCYAIPEARFRKA
jgi:FkbM family methyltransferase